MFTGIIQELGTVTRVERTNGLVRMAIAAPKLTKRLQLMESIAVNGVCLTVTGVRHGALVVEVIHETQDRTTLASLRSGARVNLEPSVAVTDRLNGHLVFGHVDGMGRIVGRRQRPSELVLDVQAAPSLRRFLVPKGPVAMDGVSLTVGRLIGASQFTIHLIPETLRRTTLATRAVGAQVNLELDYFAKLVAQFIRAR